MANILEVNRPNNKITLGTTGTTINIASHTASQPLGLDASKNLESINLTQGSVVFIGASGALFQDNSNLFWDNTNNRLGIGINTGFDPRTGITVSGDVDILHTAIDADDHAFELDINAAGFGDVKAIDIVYVSGDIGAGEDEEAILVNVDESDSGPGDIAALEVLATDVGSAKIFGLEVGINVIPIEQLSGTFGNMAKAENDGVNALTQFTTSDPGGANNIEIFVANNDTVLIGNTAKFEEIEFIFETFSNPSVKPTFEFSTGGTSFSSFTPADGTNGMRNNGVVLWLDSDIPSWATNTGGNYEIRITRTRTTLAATPKEDLIQIGTATEYVWNKDGDVNINSLTLATVAAEGSDVDKFLVDSSGVVKYRTGAQVLSDIGGSASAHTHDTDTLQLDGINSDGGAFSFTTSGAITFNQNLIIPDSGTIGQAAGPLLAFDDTNNFLEITGCRVHIGGTNPYTSLHITRFATGVEVIDFEDSSMPAIFVTAPATTGYYQPIIGVGYDATTLVATISAYDDGTTAKIGWAFHTGDTNALTEKMRITYAGRVNIGPSKSPKTLLTVEGTITLKEQASADGDTAAYGQDWVKTATPCERWFTDDTGIDYQLSGIATGVLNASLVKDWGSIADGSFAEQSVTVTGAVLGDFILVSFSTSLQGLIMGASVRTGDVVDVQLYNNTGGAIDLAEGTIYVRVLKK